VGARPALVIATPGAEPIAHGGYAAALLLDGERMLARENLRVAENCMRWWTHAAALTAPGAPTFLVSVGGPLATAFATWKHENFAGTELAERRQLYFPPAVRVASVRGEPAAVDDALAALPDTIRSHTLGPVAVGDGHVRAIVRFEYRSGPDVAECLRSSVVRHARQQRRTPRVKGGYRKPPTLRVRFDDPEFL
jgi:primosomal protein N' (replication factor Y)